ncbi:MAG: hypothetical protein ACOC5T_01890 [Elusimicrobiota bacterium]
MSNKTIFYLIIGLIAGFGLAFLLFGASQFASADVSCQINESQLEKLYNLAFHRDLDEEADFHLGHSLDQVLDDMQGSEEQEKYSALFKATKALEEVQRKSGSLSEKNLTVYKDYIDQAASIINEWSKTLPEQEEENTTVGSEQARRAIKNAYGGLNETAKSGSEYGLIQNKNIGPPKNLPRIEKSEQNSQEDLTQDREQLGDDEQDNHDTQPRLVHFEDNIGNVYTEEKDFVKDHSQPFAGGFGKSTTPLCMTNASDTNEDCKSEVIGWINDRSIEVGHELSISLDSFDSDGDDVFYFISYGSSKDYSYGNMRTLQNWDKNSSFNIPITESLYNETLQNNKDWGITFLDEDTGEYKRENVSLKKAGELNVEVCFNDEKKQMEYPFGKQFSDGCKIFEYFISKPGVTDIETTALEG